MQKIFIKAKDSDYLHQIIQQSDWKSLIELASTRSGNKDFLHRFFQTDQSAKVLKSMSEEQIFELLDVSPLSLENCILERMELLCDEDSKYSNIALKLMKEIFTHGGDFECSSVIKCLPLNIIRSIIDSRIPYNKFHFGYSKQEFFMCILSSIQTESTEKTIFQNFHYKNLKETDCSGEIFTYIQENIDSFPVRRREVFKEVIKALNDAFVYIEQNDEIEINSILINQILNPIFLLITSSLKNKVYDYRNDREIIDLLKNVFNEFYSSKFFIAKASIPILNNSGNFGLFQSSKIYEKCKIITPTFYYKVFKKAVEINKDNFINCIVKQFFTSSPIFRYMRELDDGVYDKLFNAAIDFSVKEIIEKKSSDNFSYCCDLLTNNLKEDVNFLSNKFTPKFDECLLFINSVISKIFDKKEALNVDFSTFPEICLYFLNTLIYNDCEICCLANGNSNRKINKAIYCYIDAIDENAHRPINFINSDVRNKIVLGIIRHPVDETKFSSIITSNNPTFLAKYICYLSSVSDIKLALPKSKRDKIDKYGFIECKSEENSNSKEPFLINIVELFLRTLRFWESNDKFFLKDGYTVYYQFARKILMEAIQKDDIELKKAAISVYYRYSETVSLMKNAKCICFRIHIASLTFLTPLAVIVGSEIDEKFVEKYINKYIRPFHSQSYQSILSEILSRSHIDMNYYEDEDEIDDVDQIFKKIDIDQQFAIATRMLLELIKENPVKVFHLYYTNNLNECFFISQKRYITNMKKKFEILNPKIIDICNPLKTDYPLSVNYNSPHINHVYLTLPQYKLSSLSFLEIAKFIVKEFKEYSPIKFKTKLTKQLIKIQTFFKKLAINVCDTFHFVFTLDEPTVDTIQSNYIQQEKNKLTVIYTYAFFDFLNEINNHQKSIFNKESFEIIKSAFIVRFLNEDDFFKQKTQPLPKFNGFNIIIEFKKHQNADNVFNIKNFKKMIEEYEFYVYKKVNHMNQKLIKQIDQVYNTAKLIEENPFNDVFEIDLSNHRIHEKSKNEMNPDYPMNVHKCYLKIMDSLNKSKAELFLNDFESLERLNTFKPIKNCGSDSSQYSMLTHLLDLLINYFVLSKNDLARACKNCITTYEDIYRYMTNIARITSPNIGTLKNLPLLCHLKENIVLERVPQLGTKLFEYIFKCGNTDQILTCMNSFLFVKNAPTFHICLQKNSGLIYCRQIINTIINEVLNNKKQILDVFHVALAKCSIYPRFVGFPAPQTSLEYLKSITSKNISAKRASCANAVYYAIMNFISGNKIPFNEINEIIESAHQKAPDEITAFFCLLISREASLSKIKSLPALFDLLNENVLPESFIIDQGPGLIMIKEINEIYYNCIEKVILSGLKSNKSHIYNLTVTVLNEINVGPEIQHIISPFIIKGLKELQPNDDNESFFKYATSFTMKNADFKECFDSYCEALSIIKDHSIALLRANSQINQDSPYPQTFKKLEILFTTIMTTIEKPFIEFKEDDEMISASLFCRNLLPVLRKNRPVIAIDVFLHLEGFVSIFGDHLIEEIVHLYKNDKKDCALSKFIVLITHCDELLFNIPKSIYDIYNKLKSSFSIKHTIELSKNLKNAKMELQTNYELANILCEDVLAHIPNEQLIKEEKEKGVELEIENEDEIIEVISNLGIFCKKQILCIPFAKNEKPASIRDTKSCLANHGRGLGNSCPQEEPAPTQTANEKQYKSICSGFAAANKCPQSSAAKKEIAEELEPEVAREENIADEPNAVLGENGISNNDVEDDDQFEDDVEVEDYEDAGIVSDEFEADIDENSQNQDNIKDAFDLFS